MRSVEPSFPLLDTLQTTIAGMLFKHTTGTGMYNGLEASPFSCEYRHFDPTFSMSGLIFNFAKPTYADSLAPRRDTSNEIGVLSDKLERCQSALMRLQSLWDEDGEAFDTWTTSVISKSNLGKVVDYRAALDKSLMEILSQSHPLIAHLHALETGILKETMEGFQPATTEGG